MKLDADTYANLTEKPLLNQFDLDTLANYYIKYLEPFEYILTLENKDSDTNKPYAITLRFPRNNACHLWGIDKPAKIAFGEKSPKVKGYKGLRGFKNILSGKITKQSLKGLSNQGFKDLKKKILNFYLVHTLLENPNAVLYTKQINNIKTDSVSHILYSKDNNKITCLGIFKNTELDYYVPTTFIHKSAPSGNSNEPLIDDQIILKVLDVKKLSL